MIWKLTLLFLTVLANAATPAAIDRGPLPERERQTPISVTLTLALPGLAEAEKLQQAIYTPGAPAYHQFLTADQFAAHFGPPDSHEAVDDRRSCTSVARLHSTDRE